MPEKSLIYIKADTFVLNLVLMVLLVFPIQKALHSLLYTPFLLTFSTLAFNLSLNISFFKLLKYAGCVL